MTASSISKVGDLVSVYYETRRYYIVLADVPRDEGHDHGEQKYRLLCLNDGNERVAYYSDIKTVSKAEK